MIWGFADISISMNLARDLGTRIVAAMFFGREAFTYMNYSWIGILVNIPATLFGTRYYEFLMRDSLSQIGKGHAMHDEGEEGLLRHISNTVRYFCLLFGLDGEDVGGVFWVLPSPPYESLESGQNDSIFNLFIKKMSSSG